MQAKKIRIAISERALVQRVNRVLRTRNQLLRKSRGYRAKSELGDYYIIDLNSGFIDSYKFDLEEVARELDALQDWEYLQNDEK